MKVLLLGGTGRLSKEVAAQAVDAGHEVTILTRGSASRSSFRPEGCTYLQGDVRDPQRCKEVFRDLCFDVVVDFLSFNEDQLMTSLGSLSGKFKQYIFISTATVYEEPADGSPIAEDSAGVGNQEWSYSHNKLMCEERLARESAEDGGWAYTIVRPYVTYGNTRIPYPIITQNSLAEWSLVDRIKKGKPVIVCDLGNKTTLTHATDFAKGVVGLMGNSNARNEAFHITSDETHVWDDVLGLIEGHYGLEINRVTLKKEVLLDLLPEYRDLLVGDKCRTMVFDNSKIKEAVPGFRCDTSLAAGISDTLDNFERNRDICVIDNLWNGRMDWACAKMGAYGPMGLDEKDLKERVKYFVGRHPFALKAFQRTMQGF